jgi:hypothetical protein
MNLPVFLKLLSPAYRKRRERVLWLRGIKPRRRKFFRDPMAAYLPDYEMPVRPGSNFTLVNIRAPY